MRLNIMHNNTKLAQQTNAEIATLNNDGIKYFITLKSKDTI